MRDSRREARFIRKIPVRTHEGGGQSSKAKVRRKKCGRRSEAFSLHLSALRLYLVANLADCSRWDTSRCRYGGQFKRENLLQVPKLEWLQSVPVYRLNWTTCARAATKSPSWVAIAPAHQVPDLIELEFAAEIFCSTSIAFAFVSSPPSAAAMQTQIRFSLP